MCASGLVALTSCLVGCGAVRRALRLDMCHVHTELAMLLGQVAAGAVAVGLERGERRGFTFFWCAFEFNLTY